MVCRERREEAQLRRAGRAPGGEWYLGRGSGRGLWWCREGDCGAGVSVALVSRAMRRSLGAQDVQALHRLVSRSKLVVIVEE